MKNIPYKTNSEPKVGDKVRIASDIKGGVNCVYEVISVGGGRIGNKVGVQLVDPKPGSPNCSREYYFQCFCPQ